jgi:hypothetical protein
MAMVYIIFVRYLILRFFMRHGRVVLVVFNGEGCEDGGGSIVCAI